MPDAEPQKINILLVDDNEGNLLALEAILAAADRNLVRASSGDEALRYLLDHDAAVILLDVHMPGIDGLETAALIRGRERSRDIPIIFLTADNAGGALLAKGYSLGAVDYILKPVEAPILRSKVGVFVELFKKTEEVKRQAALLREKNVELENANLRRLALLIELGQRLAAERDPERVLRKFCRAARDIVGARYAAVGMFEGDRRTLRHFHASGEDGRASAGRDIFEAGRELLGPLLGRSGPVRARLAGDGRPAADGSAPGHASTPFLGAPIVSSAQSNGWLYLSGKLDGGEFSEADERLAATLSAQAAVAYENARLYTEAQRHAAELQQEVADRKQAEQERARLLVREQAARAEAEAANRAKDEFLATLSHELRTPLTAILGWSRLLRTGNLPDGAAAGALETIERNAKAQSQLIDDLLDVSRIITGKLRLDSRPVEIAGIIAAAVDSARPAARAKNIQLGVEMEPMPGPLLGDAGRLQQVAWNLLSNAIKFTPEGGRVSVRLGRAGARAEVTVEDTGQGIAAEFLPHVFDRFRQADGTTTRRHGGLGLGLAIARHLVELHGGSIRADSPGEGRGASFSVSLPLMNAPAGGDGAEAARGAGAASPAGRGGLEGLRVLVVDDETDTRELVAFALTASGAEVRTAARAAEALDALGAWAPDVLVSDIGMPDLDGYDFIREVRRREVDSGGLLPAVALTAYAGVEDRRRAAAAGFQTHLAKPLDPGELVSVVAALVGRGPGRRGPEGADGAGDSE
ncbi:MAG TPA: response regulator [Pyrinomonadaceae bacterium]|jgi:signal transduction histidine kinase/DNA-binding response OmpR family regulator